MRVTQGARKCSYCGTPITTEEIDRQAWQRARGCLFLLAAVIILPLIVFFVTRYGREIIYVGASLILLIIIVVFVYLVSAIISENAMKKRISKFLDSDEAELLHAYIRRGLINGEEEHIKFRQLLDDKGWKFTSAEINKMILDDASQKELATANEKAKRKDQRLVERITRKNPVTRQDFLTAFLEVSRIDDGANLESLARLMGLSSKGVASLKKELLVTQQKIKRELLETEQKRQLSEFERSLLKEDKER
jgi:hypothetical protein